MAADYKNPASEALKSAVGRLQGSSGISSALERAFRGATGASAMQRQTTANLDRLSSISRSLNAFEIRDIEPLTIPRITPLSEHLEKALRKQEDRQSAYRKQQADLLASLVEVGRQQNELQGKLVAEAIENSKIQRVVLIFSAASVALGLLALVAA